MRAPYSDTDIDRIWEIALQLDGQRRRSAKTLFVLGFGAGLNPSELLHVTAAHVRRAHRVIVRTTGDLVRDVPVRTRSAPELLKLGDQYPDGPLVGPLGTSRNRLNVVVSRIVRHPRPADHPRSPAAHHLDARSQLRHPGGGVHARAGWTTGSRLG